MSIGKFMSKIVPVQIREFLYKYLLSGIIPLIVKTKIGQFFFNLTILLIFTQKSGLLGVVIRGSFM